MILQKIMRWLSITEKQKQGCGQPKGGATILPSKNVDEGTWMLWDGVSEEWIPWPNEKPLPLTRPIEYVHTKNVGQRVLYVYRDIDGSSIGLFVDRRV